jgi:molecular chaperone GrpE (heat shock protein)
VTPELKKKLEPVWWIVGIVVSILAVGYTASQKLNELQTTAAAREMGQAQSAALVTHSVEEQGKLNALMARIDEAEEEAQEARIREVRAEAQQRNISDRLEILVELSRTARTSQEREEQEERIDGLQRAIGTRERAIDRSLGSGRSLADRGPLDGLDALNGL